MTAKVREMGEIRIRWVGIFAASVEEIVARFINDGDMHMAGAPWEAFARFRHEAWGDSILGAERFDNVSDGVVSESQGSIKNGYHYLNRPALSAICLISANSRA